LRRFSSDPQGETTPSYPRRDDIAHSRATLTNTTVENTSSLLNYTGSWRNNSSPFFSGGSSSYTKRMMQLSPPSKVQPSILIQPTANSVHALIGSALYVFGDTVTDHGHRLSILPKISGTKLTLSRSQTMQGSTTHILVHPLCPILFPQTLIDFVNKISPGLCTLRLVLCTCPSFLRPIPSAAMMNVQFYLSNSMLLLLLGVWFSRRR
jgi:hypothetical protein